MFKRKQVKGSITVEAAIVLPVFICALISLAMMIKLVYIHDVVQHAIDEAANELAAYSYLYYVSDLQKLNDAIEDTLEENSSQGQAHMEAVLKAYEALENAYKTGNSIQEPIESEVSEKSFTEKALSLIEDGKKLYADGQQLSQTGIAQMNELYEVLEEACQNPQKEVESLAWLLGQGIYSESKSLLAAPIAKYTVKKYLGGNSIADADQRMKKLNVYRGFEGLDFYNTNFFLEGEDIDIIVVYRVKLPLPIPMLPDIDMVQRSTARAWLAGGAGTSLRESSIWDLPNRQRGMKIEEMYGGNLPYDFPIIDIYDPSTKTGTSIKSINLNSKTYQDGKALSKTLKGYVDELSSCQNITHKQSNYPLASKRLILVIPKGAIHDSNKAVLEQIKSYSSQIGIEITISEL